MICLNPYCSGRQSRTTLEKSGEADIYRVLILIVVDDGLVLINLATSEEFEFCLNPYCSGRWSRTKLSVVLVSSTLSLNPYCSGRWSRTILWLQ